MKQIIYAIATGMMISLTACTDYLDPNPYDGVFTDEYVWDNATFARGVLYQAYRDIPNTYRIESGQFLEYATDDAVTNNQNSNIRNLGLGTLSSTFNALNNWESSYSGIRHINEYLENVPEDIIHYAADSAINARYVERLKGEALFLRAFKHWELLRLYGGVVNGQVMGIPIVKQVLSEEEVILLERPTYSECVDAIIDDCKEAEMLLPSIYEGDDQVIGVDHYGGATSAACKALKSVVSVYHASAAYNIPQKDELWDTAAYYLVEALNAIDGSINSDSLPDRNFFDPENEDIIWRGHYAQGSLQLEQDNFSPSMFGNGRTNPSQNLVDAFPDSAGYPIVESSVYSSEAPYQNRDKRFYDWILYNGAVIDSTTIIETFQGGNDSKEVYGDLATNTGYYLKKFLNISATLSPRETGRHITYYTVFSKTDLYLLLAEVLNEIEGPNGTSVCGISAKDVLSKIRKRAGYSADPYLNGISSPDDFKDLIKNERRIELCFEGYRFWDLRRWNEKIDDVPVNGVSISRENDSTYNYNVITVETRKFNSIYMPLPDDQIQLMPEVSQNDDWN